MKLKIYYHSYLNDDYSWIYTFLDQFKLLEDCKLLESSDSIFITSLGNDEQRSLLNDIVKTYNKYNNIIINEISTKISDKDFLSDYNNLDLKPTYVSETPTIRQFWLDSFNDTFYGMYFHNKGSTAFSRCFKQHDVEKFKNYHYWRKYIEWGIIENWEECVKQLNLGAEMAGCNLNTHPLNHYSGGFWWARSDYINKLDDISNSNWWKLVKQPYYVDRLVNEMWPGSIATKFFNLHSPPENLQSPNPGLYSECFTRKNYGEF